MKREKMINALCEKVASEGYVFRKCIDVDNMTFRTTSVEEAFAFMLTNRFIKKEMK